MIKKILPEIYIASKNKKFIIKFNSDCITCEELRLFQKKLAQGLNSKNPVIICGGDFEITELT